MGFSVALSAAIVAIALLVSVAIVVSYIAMSLDRISGSLREISAYSQRSIVFRIVYANITGVYSNDTIELALTAENTGSLRMWDFNESEILLTFKNNSQILDTRILYYGVNWSIANITNNGVVIPYREGEAVYPGESFNIEAKTLVPDNYIKRDENGSVIGVNFDELVTVLVYSNGAEAEYRVVLNG